MKLTILSDTHLRHNQIKLTGGDVLIHCGDGLGMGRLRECEDFFKWFNKQPYTHKIYVPGNHDWCFQNNQDYLVYTKDVHVLIDQIVYINGVSFYGTPWQPKFNNWAFNLDDLGPEITEKYSKIPEKLDFLITHCPPRTILDQVNNGPHLGCGSLSLRMIELVYTPKYHIFGHIHSGYGWEHFCNTMHYNVALCNEFNQIVNKPIDIES